MCEQASSGSAFGSEWRRKHAVWICTQERVHLRSRINNKHPFSLFLGCWPSTRPHIFKWLITWETADALISRVYYLDKIQIWFNRHRDQEITNKNNKLKKAGEEKEQGEGRWRKRRTRRRALIRRKKKEVGGKRFERKGANISGWLVLKQFNWEANDTNTRMTHMNVLNQNGWRMVVLMRDEMSAIQHLQDLELLSLTHYKAEIYNVSVFLLIVPLLPVITVAGPWKRFPLHPTCIYMFAKNLAGALLKATQEPWKSFSLTGEQCISNISSGVQIKSSPVLKHYWVSWVGGGEGWGVGGGGVEVRFRYQWDQKIQSRKSR